MSLVSGPGRGGGGAGTQEELCIDKHVAYIQSLNNVRFPIPHNLSTEQEMPKDETFLAQ